MLVPCWSWTTGPALDPHQGPGGIMGIYPTSPHVFVDLEKTFDRVPQGVLWGSSRSLGSWTRYYGLSSPSGCPVGVLQGSGVLVWSRLVVVGQTSFQ